MNITVSLIELLNHLRVKKGSWNEKLLHENKTW
jgi:hypothetical protein